MTPESAVEEVVIVEEPAAKPGLPNRMRRPGLAVGLTVASLALSLTAATIVRLALGPTRRARRGRRRGALVVFQPQVSVFAPAVALPFSAISGGRTLPRPANILHSRVSSCRYLPQAS